MEQNKKKHCALDIHRSRFVKLWLGDEHVNKLADMSIREPCSLINISCS